MSCQKRCVCWGRISALITACYLREGVNAQLGACGEGAGSSCTPTLGTRRLAAYGHHIPCPPPCVGFLLSQPPGGGVYKFSTKLCSQCQVFSLSACKIKACCKPCVVICSLSCSSRDRPAPHLAEQKPEGFGEGRGLLSPAGKASCTCLAYWGCVFVP